MDPNDIMDRIMSAPSTVGAGTVLRSQQQNTGRVYVGGTGSTSVRVPISTTIRPNTTGASNRQRLDGGSAAPRSTRSKKTETAPGVQIVNDLRPTDELRGKVYEWYGTPAFDRWGDHLVKLGLIDEEDARNLAVLDDVWQDVLEYSEKLTGAGHRKTPFQVAELLAGAGAAGGSGRGGGGSGASAPFSGVKRTRSTNVDLTDPATARAIVHDSLSSMLGRRATDEELRKFTGLINAAERGNPTVTETATTYQDGDAVSQSSTTTGGLTATGRQQLVEEDAMALPEFGAYQAASTYFNALLGSIGSPV